MRDARILDQAPDTRFEATSDHENPIDVSDVTDTNLATMLREYLEAFDKEFGQVPRLVPLDDEGTAQIIHGRTQLDTPMGSRFSLTVNS